MKKKYNKDYEFYRIPKRKSPKTFKKLSPDFDEKETEKFAKKHTAKPWYHDFKLLFDMVTDKNYTLDKTTYLMIAGALAYVVFPVDIIPDFILGVGFLDDAFILGAVMKKLSSEIEKYKRLKEKV